MKVVMRPRNLNVHGRKKSVDDLTFSDFRVPMRRFMLAHQVLFVAGNRSRIMKSRFPRGYKPREL